MDSLLLTYSQIFSNTGFVRKPLFPICPLSRIPLNASFIGQNSSICRFIVVTDRESGQQSVAFSGKGRVPFQPGPTVITFPPLPQRRYHLKIDTSERINGESANRLFVPKQWIEDQIYHSNRHRMAYNLRSAWSFSRTNLSRCQNHGRVSHSHRKIKYFVEMHEICWGRSEATSTASWRILLTVTFSVVSTLMGLDGRVLWIKGVVFSDIRNCFKFISGSADHAESRLEIYWLVPEYSATPHKTKESHPVSRNLDSSHFQLCSIPRRRISVNCFVRVVTVIGMSTWMWSDVLCITSDHRCRRKGRIFQHSPRI
jgi:hypothetical protein